MKPVREEGVTGMQAALLARVVSQRNFFREATLSRDGVRTRSIIFA